MKPHKWEFKSNMLCDSDSKYLYNLYFDPGKFGKDLIYFEENPSITESIFLRLLSPIKDNNQRCVFFNGWYSSISLMEKRSKKNYLNFIVLRNKAKNLPSKIKEENNNSTYKNNILIPKFEDKKTILFGINFKKE